MKTEKNKIEIIIVKRVKNVQTDRQTDGNRQFGKIEEYVSHQTAKLKDDQQGDQIKSLMY